LQARGDIDAVAHEVAVAFLDDVAQMDANAKLDALVGHDLLSRARIRSSSAPVSRE
jgi:hypothetical protein